MKKTLKIMIMSAITMVMAFFVIGCDDTISTDKITAVATTIGRTAGYACELAKTKTSVKEGISTVLNVIAKVIPAEGQTFAEAWTPVIVEELQKLVNIGKLDEAGSQVAKAALCVACDGIDYVFIKYPKAKNGQELVSAATDGFIDGYRSVVTLAISADKPVIDEEAYKYLKSRMTK